MPGDKKLAHERSEVDKKGDMKIDDARGKCMTLRMRESFIHLILPLGRHARATSETDRHDDQLDQGGNWWEGSRSPYPWGKAQKRESQQDPKWSYFLAQEKRRDWLELAGARREGRLQGTRRGRYQCSIFHHHAQRWFSCLNLKMKVRIV